MSRAGAGGVLAGALSALGLLLAACTSLPRPPVLGQAESVSESRTAQHSKQRAPQAFAHAELLRGEAEDAYDSGQLELAKEIGARAIAAFQRAEAQTRVVAAEERLVQARHELAEVRQRLAKLSHRQRSVSAQAQALELQIKVERDAEAPTAVEPASPKREAARHTAAQSLRAEARLLCVATRLLDGTSAAAKTLLQKAQQQDGAMREKTGAADISEATRLRAECLAALTQARQQGVDSSPAADPADRLISQLDGAMPHAAPTRDDRGVVVSFSDLFKGGELSATGLASLRKLVQIGTANPELPLLVVHHAARRSLKIAPAQVAALKVALKEANADPIPVYSVDDRLPLALLPVKGSKLKDERVEFVFVSR